MFLISDRYRRGPSGRLRRRVASRDGALAVDAARRPTLVAQLERDELFENRFAQQIRRD